LLACFRYPEKQTGSRAAVSEEVGMPAYVVVDIDVHDPQGYEQYKAAVTASIEKYGGRYLVRGGQVETLEGQWTPGRFVLVEFPDAERARAWWQSAEYAHPKALRHATARTHMILVEGV
jgi:uncharacterized protein (DUF1330 family)